MAAFTTVLSTLEQGIRSKYLVNADHTAEKQAIVLQKRKESTGPTSVIMDELQVVYTTEDSDGVILQPKVVLYLGIRRPVNGIATRVNAARAVLADLHGSDEFTDMFNKQLPIQG